MVHLYQSAITIKPHIELLPTSNGNKKWDKVAKVSQSGKQISYEASKKNYNIVKNKSKFDFKV